MSRVHGPETVSVWGPVGKGRVGGLKRRVGLQHCVVLRAHEMGSGASPKSIPANPLNGFAGMLLGLAPTEIYVAI